MSLYPKRIIGIAAKYEIVLLAVAAPFLLFPNYWTGFAFTLIVLSWILRWIDSGHLSSRTPLDIPIAIILVMSIVAMYVSPEPSASWPKFWGIILGIAAYYGLVNGLRNVQDVHTMALVLMVVSIGVAAVSLIATDWEGGAIIDFSQVYGRIPRLLVGLPSGGVPRDTPFLGSREIGGTVGMLLPIALALYFFGKGRVTRSVAAVAGLFLASDLVLSQTFSAIIGAMVAMFTLALWQSRKVLLVVPFVIAGILVLNHSFGLGQAVLRWFEPSEFIGNHLWSRVTIWMWGLQILRDVPLTGIGLNSFDGAIQNLYPISLLDDHIIHAHNVFLQMALDLGLPGMVAFFWLLGALGSMTVDGIGHTDDLNSRAIFGGVATGVMCFTIFGLVDTFTIGAKPGVMFWAMLGLSSSLARFGNRSRIQHITPRTFISIQRKRRMVLLLLIALTVMVGGVLFKYRILQLNLGTLRAHQALAQVRQGQPVPVQLMRSAKESLLDAVNVGQSTPHTFELLGSVSGWLGEYPESVSFMQRYISQGGDRPPGSELLSTAFPSEGRKTESSRETSLGEVVANGMASMRSSIGLPRTSEVILQRFQRMSVMKSRWRPTSEWWEPRLEAALVLGEVLQDPKAAVRVLDEGIRHAAYGDVLSWYKELLTGRLD